MRCVGRAAPPQTGSLVAAIPTLLAHPSSLLLLPSFPPSGCPTPARRQDTQAKDEEIARLRQRNASLAETSRELQKSKLGAEEELEQIAKQLDSGAAGRRQPRQRGRLGSTDDGLARRDGARTPTASLEDEDEETASLPLSADLDQAELRRRLAAVERLVERYRQRLFSKEQLFLSMQDLLDEKDEASAALKKRLAATYAGYVSPVAAEAATPLGIQLAEVCLCRQAESNRSSVSVFLLSLFR